MQVKENIIPFKNSYSYYISRFTSKEFPLLVFLHGLGDSSISYQVFFSKPELFCYNIIVPDLIGYGRSGAFEEYSFECQISAVESIINDYDGQYKDIYLIAHSMAGFHAYMLAKSAYLSVKGICLIESFLTQYGSFVSEKLVKAINDGKDLDKWLEIFKNKIFELGQNDSIMRKYYASLCFTRSKAFIQNAIEIRKITTQVSDKIYTCSLGYNFLNLDKTKIVYVYGERGQQTENVTFAKTNAINTISFDTKSHWVMLDQIDNFTKFLTEWL